MSVLRLRPYFQARYEGLLTLSQQHPLCPSCCQSWALHSRSISQNALQKQHGKKHKRTESLARHERLSIPYHNANTVAGAQQYPVETNTATAAQLHTADMSSAASIDLQLDSPPVLFIRKYGRTIDMSDFLLASRSSSNRRQDPDLLTEMEKDASLDATHTKIRLIQEAVRRSPTFEKLVSSFVVARQQRRPAESPLSPALSEGSVTAIKRSVFTDSDFENISLRLEADGEAMLSRSSEDLELEWSPVHLDLASLPKYYLMLSKARLTMLVCMTSAAGYALAPGPFSLYAAVSAIAGTAMASAAANSINQILEVPFDSQMNRTKNRVLVRGCLSTFHASVFAGTMACSGTLLLYTQVNALAAGLSLFNLFLYTSVYTPLKRVSIVNTWVGSIVGAIPPLIGWAACTGNLEPAAFILAGLLYSWQFPHFNSLSWNLRPDYSKAGYRMMSVTHPDLCRRVALRHSAACVAICSAAPALGLTSWAFAVDSLVLNLYLTFLAYRFYEKADSSSSRKLFRFSLIHLPLLMTLMWVSKTNSAGPTAVDETAIAEAAAT